MCLGAEGGTLYRTCDERNGRWVTVLDGSLRIRGRLINSFSQFAPIISSASWMIVPEAAEAQDLRMPSKVPQPTSGTDENIATTIKEPDLLHEGSPSVHNIRSQMHRSQTSAKGFEPASSPVEMKKRTNGLIVEGFDGVNGIDGQQASLEGRA